MPSTPTPSRVRLRTTAAAAAIAAFALLASGCAAASQASTSGGEPQRGGELIYLDAEIPFGAQLQESGAWQDRGLLQNLTDRLVYRNPDTNEFEPWLAESWDVSDDGLTYTFVIRDDVTYSDDSPLDVENVKRNLEFQIFGQPDKAIAPNATFPDDAEITTDEATNTVTVTLPQPYAPFLGSLTAWGAGLISNSTLDLSREDQLQYTKIVGTGPFVVTSEVYGKELVLSRRDGYAWAPPSNPNQGEAYLDTVTVIPVTEDSVRLGTLRSGQADLLRYVQPSEEQALADDGYEIIAKSGVGLVNQWIFQQTAPFLDEELVRKALLVGTDRQQILDDVYTENWHAATSVLSPGTFGYEDVSAGFAFDADEANSYLDEAGFTERDADGYRTRDGERLSIKTYVDVYEISAKPLFQAIQHQWKQLGVELIIGEIDYSSYWSTAFSDPSTGVLRVGWPHPDPVGLNEYYESTQWNPLQVDDPHLDELLRAHVAATDDATRTAQLAELQEYIIEKAYVLPLFDDSQVYVAADRVHGFFLTDGALPTFQSTWVS